MREHILLMIFVISMAQDGTAKPPNIVFYLVDDLGWSDVGYQNMSIISTPNIDQLASEGVILDNYYVQSVCTPTRAALLTGKYPIHTGMQHGVILPQQPYGLPLDVTLLPQKLKDAGYISHIVGKWHLGYHEWQYTPTYRGFDTFYGFYNGAEDHWTHKKNGILDLRDQKIPVTDMNGIFSTNMFTKRVLEIISGHNSSMPLFLYIPFQSVHTPNQAPETFTNQYSFVHDETRRIYLGMVGAVDNAIGTITDAMKKRGLWENTLTIFSSDNGGNPIYGGYNWPLRGTKGSLWEGGVRGAAFVHGSMIEKKARKCKELLHVTDWFPTLTSLAGLNIEKDEFEGLDGFNAWNTISKGEPSPRKEILLNLDEHESGEATISFEGAAIRVGNMKLLMNVINFPWFISPELGDGGQKYTRLLWEVLIAGIRPVEDMPEKTKLKLKNMAIKQALFDIDADPEERHDLSEIFPDIVARLKSRVDFYRKSLLKIRNKPNNICALKNAQRDNVWGPWKGTE